jgi:hypothetical protein
MRVHCYPIRFVAILSLAAAGLTAVAFTSDSPPAQKKEKLTPKGQAVDDWYALPSSQAKPGGTLVVDGSAGRPSLLANDVYYPQVEEKDLTVEYDKGEKGGTVTPLKDKPPGTFTFTAGADWNGSDEFYYHVIAGGKEIAFAKVTIGIRYPGFTYFIDRDGDPKDQAPKSRGGLLIGGGIMKIRDLDWTWFIQHTNGGNPSITIVDKKKYPGGDIVVLTASDKPCDSLASVISRTAFNHLALNSVETIVFDTTDFEAARAAAMKKDGKVQELLEHAEGILIDEGNPFVYWHLWQGTEVQRILNDKIDPKKGGQKAVVGGIGGGASLLGGMVYLPPGSIKKNPKSGKSEVVAEEGLSSQDALKKVYGSRMDLKTDFIRAGWLNYWNVVVETQGGPTESNSTATDPNLRGRMGRCVALMAAMRMRGQNAVGSRQLPHGIVLEDSASLLFNTVKWDVEGFGENTGEAGSLFAGEMDFSHKFVYLLTAESAPRYVKNKRDNQEYLDYRNIAVAGLRGRSRVPLDKWKLVEKELHTSTISAGLVGGIESLFRKVPEPSIDVYGNRVEKP